MNDAAQSPPKHDINWSRRIFFTIAAVIAAVLAYFVGGAMLPRWWAVQVGNQVNQSTALGVLVGLFYGIVFTFLPLLVLYFGFHKRRPLKAWLLFVVGALVLATPNLLTLGIVLGNGNAAHAGERILDTEASYFRGSSAVGAVIGLLLFLFTLSVLLRRHRLRDRERAVKAEQKALERQREELSKDKSA